MPYIKLEPPKVIKDDKGRIISISKFVHKCAECGFTGGHYSMTDKLSEGQSDLCPGCFYKDPSLLTI